LVWCNGRLTMSLLLVFVLYAFKRDKALALELGMTFSVATGMDSPELERSIAFTPSSHQLV
jgi:hypothetical protein